MKSLIVGVLVLLHVTTGTNPTKYFAYETEQGYVFCPDASTVENPTDGILQDLVRPQTDFAVNFCAGGDL